MLIDLVIVNLPRSWFGPLWEAGWPLIHSFSDTNPDDVYWSWRHLVFDVAFAALLLACAFTYARKTAVVLATKQLDHSYLFGFTYFLTVVLMLSFIDPTLSSAIFESSEPFKHRIHSQSPFASEFLVIWPLRLAVAAMFVETSALVATVVLRFIATVKE